MVDRHHLLYWIPRVLGLGFVAFISLFALDVFDAGYGPGETLIALAVHLVPSAVLLGIVLLAWTHERAGAGLFVLAGLLYLLVARGHVSWMLLISGPLFALAALFLASKRAREARRLTHA